MKAPREEAKSLWEKIVVERDLPDLFDCRNILEVEKYVDLHFEVLFGNEYDGEWFESAHKIYQENILKHLTEVRETFAELAVIAWRDYWRGR